MTCDECNEIQNTGSGLTFYRVGKSNVMVVGCKKHVAIMFKTLNKYVEEHGGLCESIGGEIR